MSYSITIIGRDKAKLKAAIREQQCKDEEKSPHSGVPGVVADRLCAEVDRVRIYEYAGRAYGVKIDANGSFHDSGATHNYTVSTVQMVE